MEEQKGATRNGTTVSAAPVKLNANFNMSTVKCQFSKVSVWCTKLLNYFQRLPQKNIQHHTRFQRFVYTFTFFLYPYTNFFKFCMSFWHETRKDFKAVHFDTFFLPFFHLLPLTSRCTFEMCHLKITSAFWIPSFDLIYVHLFLFRSFVLYISIVFLSLAFIAVRRLISLQYSGIKRFDEKFSQATICIF